MSKRTCPNCGQGGLEYIGYEKDGGRALGLIEVLNKVGEVVAYLWDLVPTFRKTYYCPTCGRRTRCGNKTTRNPN